MESRVGGSPTRHSLPAPSGASVSSGSAHPRSWLWSSCKGKIHFYLNLSFLSWVSLSLFYSGGRKGQKSWGLPMTGWSCHLIIDSFGHSFIQIFKCPLCATEEFVVCKTDRSLASWSLFLRRETDSTWVNKSRNKSELYIIILKEQEGEGSLWKRSGKVSLRRWHFNWDPKARKI